MTLCGYPEVPETRQGENHVAVRFRDDPFYKAFLNDDELKACCLEAFAGDDGWAIVVTAGPFSPRKSVWPCCREPHYEKRYGKVRIERRVLAGD